MVNPYSELDDFCFWSRAMLNPAPGHIDPVIRARKILAKDKVATMGSCFAQHLAKHIKSSGLNYFVPEAAPPEMTPQEALSRNFGVFSARYGNVYTVRQALQLFDRAFGQFVPKDDIWVWKDRYVDAFRPQIEPEGFATPSDARMSAESHLAHVRDVFRECNWLVFTLGLTEAWRSKLDGAIYPLAPGVNGGTFDPERYEFVNFTAEQVQADLELLLTNLWQVNPKANVLLTVSPVPLIATYEKRHVWVSTTLSKAVLRVAADAMERKFDKVIYFPSYEIVTSPASGSRYYADDLRQITDMGVKHVMRMFHRHFISADIARPVPLSCGISRVSEINSDIVCDEEVIERAIRISGF